MNDNPIIPASKEVLEGDRTPVTWNGVLSDMKDIGEAPPQCVEDRQAVQLEKEGEG